MILGQMRSESLLSVLALHFGACTLLFWSSMALAVDEGFVPFYAHHYGGSPREIWRISCSKDPFADQTRPYCSLEHNSANIAVLLPNEPQNSIQVWIQADLEGTLSIKGDKTPAYTSVQVLENPKPFSSDANVSQNPGKIYKIDIPEGNETFFDQLDQSEYLYVRLKNQEKLISTWQISLRYFQYAYLDYQKKLYPDRFKPKPAQEELNPQKKRGTGP